MRPTICLLVAMLSMTTVAAAQGPQDQLVASPPLATMKSTTPIDFGTTDAVCACPENGLFIVRRGNSLFSLETGAVPTLKKRTTTPLANAAIVTGARSGMRSWLFMQSGRKMPYALDVDSGESSSFDIPGVTEPEEDVPVIQSCVVISKADAALLVIDRGNRRTVPLKEKRYVCFWISLSSGKVVAIPFGWSLSHFSADQSVAVFFTDGPKKAIDIATGEVTEQIPNVRTDPTVPPTTDSQLTKPVYVRRPQTGDTMHFAGLSVDGAVIPLGLNLPTVHYLAAAKVLDGFVGFRLRREGETVSAPGTLRIARRIANGGYDHVDDDVIEFAMLGGGSCVFVKGKGNWQDNSEAFCFASKDKSKWKVVDDLDRELAKKANTTDSPKGRTAVRLVAGFGEPENNALVGCSITHWQNIPAAERRGQGSSGESFSGCRFLIVTSNGKPHLTNFFRNGDIPSQLWLQNSGHLIWRTDDRHLHAATLVLDEDVR